ncbi:MAG: YdcF family protein [Taibaiella sp.]|nr:YdcF family protein [Taibaiella sp.]
MAARYPLLIIVIVVLIAGGIFLTDRWVTRSTQSQLYSDTATIPVNKVGLLLGTSKYLGRGKLNPYYQYRIDAAVLLYKSRKILYILVSGDNATEHYNEPEQMKKDLIARGIPPERIFTDYAGFRTLDSILRCKLVFDEDRVTVISQPFHNERALFIANRNGISAIGFNAQDVTGENGLKVAVREKLARIKMLIDLFLNTQPKYYGPRIIII